MLLVRAEENSAMVKTKEQQVYLTRDPKRNDTGFLFLFNYTIYTAV